MRQEAAQRPALAQKPSVLVDELEDRLTLQIFNSPNLGMK